MTTEHLSVELTKAELTKAELTKRAADTSGANSLPMWRRAVTPSLATAPCC